jgi:uncharacterized protein (DUF924 family)
MVDHETILSFWFGDDPDKAALAKDRTDLWWSKKPHIDAAIRARFETIVQRAGAAELDTWLAAPRGRLALIILTDQFPRNIYRDRPQAFDFDKQAQQWCCAGIDQGHDRQLRPIERTFFICLWNIPKTWPIRSSQSVCFARCCPAPMPTSRKFSHSTSILQFCTTM